jgi:hypothetical protein
MKTHVRICMSLLAAGLSAAALAATPDEARRQRMDEAYQDYRSGGTRADTPGPAERAENSIKRGMHRAGNAIRHGAHKTGEAIGKGVRKTGDAMHRAGEKVEGKSQE